MNVVACAWLLVELLRPNHSLKSIVRLAVPPCAFLGVLSCALLFCGREPAASAQLFLTASCLTNHLLYL